MAERWIAESVLVEHLEAQIETWQGTDISPEHLIKHLLSNDRHLADIGPDR